jgi:DedD protein
MIIGYQMTKNISEEELLLRKRARRRLVGAIVLVIFSVILLPIIFDEPREENEPHEIAINLPTLSKGNKNDSAQLAKEKLIARGGLDKAEPVAELNDSSIAGQQNIEDFIENLNEQKRIPIPGIKPKIDGKYPIETKNVIALTTVTPNLTNSTAATADLSKGFVIQLGAFSDRSKAKQQLDNLIANGFKAYTEVVKTGGAEVTRVRIGSFATRDAADNELRKLNKLGYEGVIASR